MYRGIHILAIIPYKTEWGIERVQDRLLHLYVGKHRWGIVTHKTSKRLANKHLAVLFYVESFLRDGEDLMARIVQTMGRIWEKEMARQVNPSPLTLGEVLDNANPFGSVTER
jgi:hypothetical protein